MTLLGVLALGRAHANARMTQTWRIGTLTETTDPVTFVTTQTLDAVYDGIGRFKAGVWTTSEPSPGGQPIAQQSAELHVPSGTVGVEVDMVAVCDAAPDDPTLVGRVVRMKGRPAAGQTTAQRWAVADEGLVIVEGS